MTGTDKRLHRRLAKADDLDAVFAIYMHEQVVPYLGYDPMPIAAFADIFNELVASRSFFIYEDDAQTAGFYKATRYPGRAQHVVQLGALAVRPDLHGSGVARAMISDAIACLRTDDVRRIELYVESDNPRAIRFYESLGFQKEALLRQFYKRADQDHYIDEHVMSLIFDDSV